MKVLLISNPCANGGGALKVLKRVEQFLAQNDLIPESIETPQTRSIPAPDWQAYTHIVLVGGDGTLHRLLNYWGIPPLPVCLISAGSGNDFSRLSHKSANIEVQLGHLLEGKTYRGDLGLCNGVLFATGVGIGFDGKVAEILQGNVRWKSHLAYLLVVIVQLFRYREKWIHLLYDGGQEKGKSLLFTVGNGSEFGGGFKVTPQASFTDGIFQCCLIREVSLLKRILHLGKIEKGTHAGLPFVQLFDAQTIHLQSDEVLVCHMDGEVYRWKEFQIEMRAGVLQLIG